MKYNLGIDGWEALIGIISLTVLSLTVSLFSMSKSERYSECDR